MNGFHKDYILHFIKGANAICSEEKQRVLNGIVLGSYERSPFSFDTINKVLSRWVQGIDRLIVLSLSAGDKPNSARIAKLYEQRGIHYEEFYYLVNDQVPQEEYIKTPAFIFTKIFSKDQRKRKFGHISFTEEDFLDFILPLNIVPSIYLSNKRETIIPIESLFAHSYCVAKTRSGKTETLKLIVHGLIQKRDQKTSLLILDPHGEFAREVRRFKILQEQRDDFIYIDPSIDSDFTPVFNPFEIPPSNTSDLVYKSDSILDAFQQLLKDQIISGNMKRLLRHCINALLYMPDTSMMDLLTLLMTINRNRTLKVPEFYPREAQLMEFGRLAPDPLTRKFFEFGYRDVDARTIGAVIERVDGILSHPLVRKFVIGKNSFDLCKYLNEGKIVVVNLDFTKLGNIGSEAIGRLLVSEAQNISAQRNILPKQGRPRTIIFMDECQRFVSAAIERALSEFAKFNTYLFLAHQYIEQIDDGMVKAMLSNTENKFVGRNSAASMASISADVGVSKATLMNIKKYQFFVKSSDQDAYIFNSSDVLLTTPQSEYYISEGEAKLKIDQYMIKHYYRRVKDESSVHNQVNPKECQNSDFTTMGGHISVDNINHPGVTIDENDF